MRSFFIVISAFFWRGMPPPLKSCAMDGAEKIRYDGHVSKIGSFKRHYLSRSPYTFLLGRPLHADMSLRDVPVRLSTTKSHDSTGKIGLVQRFLINRTIRAVVFQQEAVQWGLFHQVYISSDTVQVWH